MQEILFSSLGEFEWGIIAAIASPIAVIVSVVSIFNNNKQNKKNRQANLIHKSRAKWMEEIRDLTAELETKFFVLKNERYRTYYGIESKSKEEKEELIRQTIVAAAKLKMYFISDDERDEKIKGIIENEERKSTQGNVADENFFVPYLSDDIASYLREEWLDTQKKLN